MPEEVMTEHYAMQCRGCTRTWQVIYQVRLLQDDAGEHRLYFQHGIPVTAPGSTPCPYCNEQRVTLVPWSMRVA